jgi:membrane protease YdiL (CAAX protease family)
MLNFFKTEPRALWGFLKDYRREALVLAAACLFLTLERYHPLPNEWFDQLFYFGILPILVIWILLRRNPLDFGLRLGNFRVWGPWTLLTILILAPILWWASTLESFQEYYKADNFNFIYYLFSNMVILMAWEFIFRGFMLFGLKERFKEGAILVQMIPFVITHFYKPELETISTILTGIYFGYVCYRGNSYWPAFIIHIFINIFFVAVINLR